jgi:Periplasmic binding protein
MPAAYGLPPMSDLSLRVAAGIAAICLALSLVACGEEQDPVRVGVLTECVGPFEASKETMLAAAALPFLERGARLQGDGPMDGLDAARVGGRPIELLVGCTIQSDQVRQIVETRRLIEDEGADVIIGPVGEAEGVLVRRLAERYPDVTFILGISAAQETTLHDSQPNVFRFVADGAQSAAGLATHAFRDLGWRRAAGRRRPGSSRSSVRSAAPSRHGRCFSWGARQRIGRPARGFRVRWMAPRCSTRSTV